MCNPCCVLSYTQGLKSEDGKTRDGSRYFLQQLLAPPQHSAITAGATANGHASTSGVPRQCLAAEVLATQTDTQHWLRNTAKAFRAGKSGSSSAHVCVALVHRLSLTGGFRPRVLLALFDT